MDEPQARLIMFTVAVITLIIAFAPAGFYFRERITLRTWPRTEARIQLIFTENHQTTSGAVTGSKSARYVFRTPDGEIHQGESQLNEHSSTRKIGEIVEVRYNPRNPDKNTIYMIPKIFWYVVGIPWTILFIALAGVCASDAIWGIMSK